MINGQPAFGRGGLGGPDGPPRRRRFRGQYVRRRTPSGGGGNYRGGSFSDDRNDSSPPPNTLRVVVVPPNHHQNNRSMPQNDDIQQQQQQSSSSYGGGGSGQPNYYQQPPPQRMQQQQPRAHQRNQHRGPRHHDGARQHRGGSRGHHDNRSGSNQQFYDNNQTQNMPSRDYDYSDNDYDGNFADEQHSNNQLSSAPAADGHGAGPTSNRKIDELSRSFQGQKTDIDEIKNLFSKLTTELDQVRSRVKELESTVSKQPSQQNQHQPSANNNKEGGDLGDQHGDKDKRKKSKFLKQREKKAAKMAEKRAAISENASQPERQQKILNQEQASSTTQAAEPSSEDRPENDEGNGKVRMLRKKKHFARRGGAYGNRRRRADSSERNSNDTSPQNEANGNGNYHMKRKKKFNNRFRTFPELPEAELSEIVEALKHDFINAERPLKEIKDTMNEKGPKVVYGFAVAILDHAILNITSPPILTAFANNLYQLIVSEDNTKKVDFQRGFYEALNDISKREKDIIIDAPRFLDILGQVLAECVVPMTVKHKNLIRKFLNKSVNSYSQSNRAPLLASIMRSIADIKTERFAKEIWDLAQLKWDNVLSEGTELNQFLDSEHVKFTTREFTPELTKPKIAPEELGKLADDVTSLVEKKCTPEAIKEHAKDLSVDSNDVDYLGTLVYAIVRGCILMDSGDYSLNEEALNKYSSILNSKNEKQVAIALHALTALTKLWHSYNSPQDLLRNILKTLHNNGTAPYEALKTWLESDNLKNTPGIGAARLNCKRYILDLGANLKTIPVEKN